MNQPDMEAQLELEKLFHKNQLLSRLRQEFSVTEIISYLEVNQIPRDFGLDLLVQMVIHKRASMSVLVGLLHRHFTYSSTPILNLDKGLQACCEAVQKAALVGLVNWDTLSEQFTLAIDVTPNVYAELELYQYPLPMLVEPRQVKTNKDSGYLTHGGSLILKGGNHHEDDICLDHINRVNSTPLTINADTARMVKNQWKNLDRQKPDETAQDYRSRVTAFEKYDRNSREVMEHLYMVSDRFWLTHKYDKRGRTYCQGYHVDYQGNDWNKAVLEFFEQEVVN